jgi:hypothetical protein
MYRKSGKPEVDQGNFKLQFSASVEGNLRLLTTNSFYISGNRVTYPIKCFSELLRCNWFSVGVFVG